MGHSSFVLLLVHLWAAVESDVLTSNIQSKTECLKKHKESTAVAVTAFYAELLHLWRHITTSTTHSENLGGHLWDDNVRLTRTWSLLKNSAKDNLGSLMPVVSDRHHWDENPLNSQAQAWSRVICCTGNHPCLMSLHWWKSSGFKEGWCCRASRRQETWHSLTNSALMSDFILQI